MVKAAVAAGAVMVVLGLGAVGVAASAPEPSRLVPGLSRVPGVEVSGVAAPDSRAADAGVPAVPAAVAGFSAVPTPDAGVLAVPADAEAPARTYLAPLDSPVVVARPFDGPAQPWAAGHRGVDLTAQPGQVVRAPEAGVVTFAGTVVDRGVVTVTHDDGLRSSLEPVRWSVRAGQRVVRGQVVGSVADGPGHCAPATCLHWGLRRGDTYLDPMRWVLDRGPIVLLPEG